jgi:hypothetical protein
MSLHTSATNNTPSVSCPASAAFIDSMPLPRTRGAARPMMPTARPPSAAFSSGRSFTCAKRSSAPSTQRM